MEKEGGQLVQNDQVIFHPTSFRLLKNSFHSLIYIYIFLTQNCSCPSVQPSSGSLSPTISWPGPGQAHGMLVECGIGDLYYLVLRLTLPSPHNHEAREALAKQRVKENGHPESQAVEDKVLEGRGGGGRPRGWGPVSFYTSSPGST